MKKRVHDQLYRNADDIEDSQQVMVPVRNEATYAPTFRQDLHSKELTHS